MFKRIFGLIGLCVITLLTTSASADIDECRAGPPLLEISESNGRIDLSGVLAQFAETGSHRPSYLGSSHRWCRNDGKIWSYAGDKTTHWYGLVLQNVSDIEIERVFSFDTPLYDEVNLFLLHPDADAGTNSETRLASLSRDKLSYKIIIPPKSTVSVLTSIDATRFYVGARLSDLSDYLETSTNRSLATSLILGALLCILLVQALLLRSAKQHLPLMLLALAVFSYEFVHLGYAITLFGSATAFTEYKPQLLYLVIMAVTAFAASYFELQKRNRRLLGLYQIACGTVGVLILISLMNPLFPTSTAGYLVLFPMALVFATAIYQIRYALISTTFLWISALPTMLGILIVKGVETGTLTYNSALVFSADVGATLSLLIVMLIVSYKIEYRRQKQEAELRQTQRRYQLALEGSNDGIFDWDLTQGQILASQRAYEIVGLDYDPGWRSESSLKKIIPEAELERISRMREAMFVTKDLIRVETFSYNDTGDKIFLLLQGKLDLDAKGRPARIIGSISDVSEQKHLEKRLRHDALHDFLTGLPNRTLLIDRMQRVVERLKRNPDSRAALLFLDVDNFKAINDNLGHGFGDQVLVSLSERLLELIRTSDTVARLSGDEFVILLEDMFSHREAERFANRLLTKVQTGVEILGHYLVPSVSIGMTMIEDPNISVETVLGDADIAMYTAKERGKSRVVAFEQTMRTRAAKRLEIESALRQAIENEELFLAYQPIFSIDSDEPNAVGVEALLRWNRAERQDIAPSELLMLAEENGMIEDIGKWVVRTAATQLEEWRAAGYPEDFYININLSAVHFENEDIVSIILKEIDPRGVPRNSLRIEIVESAVIRHPDKALNVIKLLQSQGILVSIDDFGTGFSSLSYLHRFPFYALKIDRSFVLEIAESKATRDIVSAIVMLARRLGIKVVAEGIENRAQLEFLRSIGCEMGQGFLLAHPAASTTVDKFFMLTFPKSDSDAKSSSRPGAITLPAGLVSDATA